MTRRCVNIYIYLEIQSGIHCIHEGIQRHHIVVRHMLKQWCNRLSPGGTGVSQFPGSQVSNTGMYQMVLINSMHLSQPITLKQVLVIHLMFLILLLTFNPCMTFTEVCNRTKSLLRINLYIFVKIRFKSVILII